MADDKAPSGMQRLGQKAAEAKKAVDEKIDTLSDRLKPHAAQIRDRAHSTGTAASGTGAPFGATHSPASSPDGLSGSDNPTRTGATSEKEYQDMDQKQAEQMRTGKGFVAALDQSGGSTPKALKLYGIEEDRYSSEAEMFDLIHEMRARIVRAPAFTGDKVVGAILFEMTMDREFGGKPAATYLWEDRGVVPFLKCDKGLEAEENGVQLMKDMGDLDGLLARAAAKGIFGTKMRSVINAANPAGIKAIVAQQFAIGKQILGHGLMPILEPEVNITIADKAEAEAILRDEILAHLDQMDTEVMLKLSLPSEANFYRPLIEHKNVMRVVALSGGYSRDEANALLAKNSGMIASFSRALTEGVSDQQSDEEFNAMIAGTIASIYEASIT